MAAGLRAYATAGDRQSAGVTSLSITVPTSGDGGTVAAGDYAVIAAEAVTTTANLTTPTGWTLLKGPIRTSNQSGWLYGKSLVAGDLGASVSLSFGSTFVRCGAQMFIGSGVDATGVKSASTAESTYTSSPTLPTIASVASGSLEIAAFMRRASGTPAATLTAPSAYTRVVTSATSYGTAPELSLLTAYQVASSAGTAGGQAAASSPATVGVNFLVTLPATSTAGSGATVTGAVLAASFAMPAGTVSGGSAPVTSASSTFEQVWRSGGMTVVYSAAATTGGVPVQGAQDLRPIGGQIVDTTKAGVRRTLTLDLAPDLISGTPLYELLTPAGTQLKVTAHCSAGSVPIVDVAMGVFDVDAEQVSEGGGKITLTAPDKWDRIRRARFLQPQASSPGIPVVQQITLLVQGALGAGETVLNLASSAAQVGALTWDRDRDKAIQDLARSIGAWVYFDEFGQCTIADIPTMGSSADWLINSGSNGVLTSLDRSRTRQGAYNVVVVSSSASTGEAFPTQYIWDDDPNSPTYAGKDPLHDPGSAGPFGIVPVFYASPILASVTDARQAGAAILATTVGLASQVSLGGVPNPKLKAGQVIDVLPPPIQWSADRVLERHVCDTVTHPLVFDSSSQPMTIAGRSTRVDPYVSDVSG